jgi:ubiquinone/menaquinone biosynthesis C-methylase UbiE
MSPARPSSAAAGGGESAVGVEAAYDAVAAAYSAAFGNELDSKPLDRALLTAFTDLVGTGIVCDVGCGPGHVTRFLAQRYSDVTGLDLSSAMVEIARKKAPELTFDVGSMTDLPATDAAWAGIVSLYSIIHFTPEQLARACREFARVLRPGGWLLVAFHVDSPQFRAGAVNHVTSWFGKSVELDGYFLDPDDVARELSAAGFTVTAQLQRQPITDVEYPSRRCYFLAQR